VLLVSLLAVWFIPSVEDFMKGNPAWNGLRTFVNESSATVLSDMNQLVASPDRSALIVIPYMEYTEEALARLKNFTADGGVLLLLDDYGFGNDILASMGVEARFGGRPLFDPLFNYRHKWLPKIVDFSPNMQSGREIKMVVLNHATALSNIAESEALALSSRTSYLDLNENEQTDKNEPVGPFPVAAQIKYGKGLLVIVADPSVMINSMVNREDNFTFLNGLVSLRGERLVHVDTSHLTRSRLDFTKSGLARVRDVLAMPYALLGIISIVFIGVTGAMIRGGRVN
jgi:hypothetical protein